MTIERRFIGAALKPGATYVPSSALSEGAPPLPTSFGWKSTALTVSVVVTTWRSTKNDRGDDYLAKHWYEIVTTDGRSAVIYFDRKARRGQARWWLHSLSDAIESKESLPR